MPAKDLGSKWTCFKCSTKFYDLKKPEPLCPKCGSDQRESPALKPASETKRSRLAAVPKPVEPVAAEPDAVEEADDLDGLEEDDEEEATPDEE